jgi:hypothetical protein
LENISAVLQLTVLHCWEEQLLHDPMDTALQLYTHPRGAVLLTAEPMCVDMVIYDNHILKPSQDCRSMHPQNDSCPHHVQRTICKLGKKDLHDARVMLDGGGDGAQMESSLDDEMPKRSNRQAVHASPSIIEVMKDGKHTQIYHGGDGQLVSRQDVGDHHPPP